MIDPLTIFAVGLTVVLLFTATIAMTLRSPSRVRLAEKLKEKNREHYIDRHLESAHELATCVAVVRTACSLMLVLVILRICQTSAIESVNWQYAIAFVASLILVIVFGVAIPAAWSRHAGESLLASVIPLVLVLRVILYPLVAVLGSVDSLVRRLAGIPRTDDEDETRHEKELLAAVSEGELLGAVDEEEKEMIESVMDLDNSHVSEIMTPRTEIAAVEKATSLDDVKTLIRNAGHSRIPVFDETIDNVLGIIYAKDLLHIEESNFACEKVMRTVPFIPESKNLRELLHEFQAQKKHMAIVLDEYGGTAGLVTIEDILEELVGEIVDEYDQEEPAPLIRVDEHTADVDARISVDELNEELDISLPEDEDYETLGRVRLQHSWENPGSRGPLRP